MKIAVINASSQSKKNNILFELTKNVVEDYGCEVVNLGCFEDECEEYSYIETALEISLLINSKAIDFVVTGCSSGQGMSLACNQFFGLFSAYLPTPQDAFLFGRINGGNVASFPLGLNFGWLGELNLKNTLVSLFDGPFGQGYPEKDAQRKRYDSLLLKNLGNHSKKNLIEFFETLDDKLKHKILSRDIVTNYVIECGQNIDIVDWVKENKLIKTE